MARLLSSLAGDAVGRSAYDVEGDKMGAAYVVKDSDVLRPTRGRKYGPVSNEIIDAGACSAPQEGSFAERLMSCPQDDGNLAPAGVDRCFGAADTYSVRRDDAPGAVEHECRVGGKPMTVRVMTVITAMLARHRPR